MVSKAPTDAVATGRIRVSKWVICWSHMLLEPECIPEVMVPESYGHWDWHWVTVQKQCKIAVFAEQFASCDHPVSGAVGALVGPTGAFALRATSSFQLFTLDSTSNKFNASRECTAVLLAVPTACAEVFTATLPSLPVCSLDTMLRDTSLSLLILDWTRQLCTQEILAFDCESLRVAGCTMHYLSARLWDWRLH